MSVFSLRALLIVILIGTIAIRVNAAVVPLIDVATATSRVLDDQGFKPDPSDGDRGILSFSNPGCRLPLKVTSVSFYLADAIAGNEAIPDYVQRFAYLGRQWSSYDRFAMREEWLKYRLLSLFGLSPYVPTPVALQIAVPVDCRAADVIDWSRIWAGERNTKSGNEPRPGIAGTRSGIQAQTEEY